MTVRDYFLGGTLPPPDTPLVDLRTGYMTEPWRVRAEAEHTALFGPDGGVDVTADIPTGSYVGAVSVPTTRGLTVAGTPAPGYTVTLELAQDIRPTASPSFVGMTLSGNVSVSGLVDGRDVSVDGAKLDTIETGATGDQTATEIRTLLLTVDGATSGIDADLLDGQHGTHYLARANHTGTQLLSTISDVTITAANLNALDDGANTTLHFHSADRSRANHTGTQTASTISDFDSAADARVTAGITGKADKQGTALTDAVTSHTLDATYNQTQIEAALNALGTRINAIHTVLRAAGVGT